MVKSWWEKQKMVSVARPTTLNALWKLANSIYGTSLYRGVSDASYTLSPRVHRSENHVKNEWNMMSEFQTRIRSFGHIPKNKLELLALAQHHGLPTRCMDVTYSFGVALYFATQGEAKKDAMIWCLDATKMMGVTIAWFQKYGVAAASDLTSDYSVFGTPPKIEGNKLVPISSHADIDETIDSYMTNTLRVRHPPVLVAPPHVSDRMRAQDGSFLFLDPIGGHLGTQLKNLEMSEALKGILLTPELKRSAKDHLQRLGITKRMIFPDIDNLASDLADEFDKN